MKKYIPNTLTSLNLVCGIIGIIQAFNGDLKMAVSLIWLAGLFDFLDGFAARLLKVSSEIGKQLDSLADMVTFGVLPSIVMYLLIDGYAANNILPFVALFLAVFSALRLAKFNIDERQATGFIGLPTPATAIFVSSLPFILDNNYIAGYIEYVPIVLIVITILLSVLMIAELPLLALKFKNFTWVDNKLRYVFLIISIALLVTFQVVSVPMIILVYILASIVENRRSVTV
ncbi:MAG: CDP-diacylglycerol--serine O-phosphatidyltransferase [Cyclobacteriaceae bacterium]|nr:CDP-diacylglycerol--serine O-phosphatidyltransferase [Cyclobacteriaceae bacterium]